MIRAAATLVAAAALVLVASAPIVHAAPTSTVIQGSVLRLVSVQDAAAMAAMVPGVPVAWDVGVSASRPDGTIRLALDVDATDGAFDLDVSSCPTEWALEGCVGGATPLADTTLADTTLVDGRLDLGEQRAGDERWYRVAVTLTAPLGEHRADLVFRAEGMGDTVASDGDDVLGAVGPGIGGLPATGLGVQGLALGIPALVLGAAAMVAARRRTTEVRP